MAARLADLKRHVKIRLTRADTVRVNTPAAAAIRPRAPRQAHPEHVLVPTHPAASAGVAIVVGIAAERGTAPPSRAAWRRRSAAAIPRRVLGSRDLSLIDSNLETVFTEYSRNLN